MLFNSAYNKTADKRLVMSPVTRENDYVRFTRNNQ